MERRTVPSGPKLSTLVATGKITDQCYDRHGKAEFLDFLKKVAKAYPRRELHVVLDNHHTQKHDEINAWLAKHPRITLHFTPTSGSWLDLVEGSAVWRHWRSMLPIRWSTASSGLPRWMRWGLCC